MDKLIAFPYYGGKQKQLAWLLPLLSKCDHFVEPFCGAASVILNRLPGTSLETINDINGDIVNFFRVLRDRGDELINKLQLTPYSREEFTEALEPTDEPVERARRFYVKCRQGFGGVIHKITSGNWGYGRKKLAPLPSRIVRSVEQLELIVDRLKLVQIENRPALDVIRRFDDPGVLFYCDPPYVGSSRGKGGPRVYGDFEMTDDDHRELSAALHGCEAKVAISGQRCPLYDELYSNWTRHDKADNYLTLNNKPDHPSTYRIDSLWTNYDILDNGNTETDDVSVRA